MEPFDQHNNPTCSINNTRHMTTLRYLNGYPDHLLQQVRTLIERQQLGSWLNQRYPDGHDVISDRALYDYTQELKSRYLRTAPPISKVCYDSKINVLQHALGLHTSISRIQGGKLKNKKEIRIAALFRKAPMAFLRVIVVHELAHLRERDHNKAFYQLCLHMEPHYHQLEFDMRLYLTQQELLTGSAV